MKTEFIDLSDTKKNLVVEIPSTTVDAEIDKVARDYGRAARIPGFRPGKVPQSVVRQRFRDQILHDVAHGLIPRAVDEALRERGVEPVDTPDIKDVVIQEGQPLKFTAAFDTVPPIDPGDYSSVSIRRRPVQVGEDEVEQALAQLRDRAARYEPVEGRGIERGDSIVLDMKRTATGATGEATTDKHEAVTVDVGATANPPGFDDALLGLEVGGTKSFDVAYPADYAIQELAGSTVQYEVDVKAIRRRVMPELDDEFAKDLGQFDSIAALRDQVRQDLRHEKTHESERDTREDLLQQYASRVTIEVPASLLDREVDRRVEEFVRRLIEQQIDPMRADINWEEFRERQRAAADQSVRTALILDEIARREQLAVSAEEVDAEVDRYAARAGRTGTAVRARLEKEGGLARLYTGLRREKAVDFLLGRATVLEEGPA